MNVMKELRLRGAISTQREVAKALGIQSAAVSKWECGVSKPKSGMLPAIAKLYGCTIEELLADELSDDSSSVKTTEKKNE